MGISQMFVRLVSLWTLLLGVWFDDGGLAVVEAGGKGPTGLYPTSDGRHVIVADSSLPGLLLVDLQYGETVERLDLSVHTDFERISPTGIATCGSCDYLFVSGNGGKYVAVYLTDTVDHLLSRHGRLGFDNDDFSNATSGDLGVQVAAMRQFRGQATDGRGVVMTSDGASIYMTDLNNSTVYVIRGVMSHKEKMLQHASHRENKLPKVRLLAKIGKRKSFPYGISWASGDDEEEKKGCFLWITTHIGRLRKLDCRNGEVQDFVNMVKIGCPGTGSDDDGVNMRVAVEDVRSKDDPALLVLGNFPATLEAALWRVHLKSKKCEMVFGGIGGHSDWIDGAGASAMFTRPHSLVVHPDKTTAIVTDTDNRALRLLNLTSGTSSSVMYDRDLLLRDREEERGMRSELSCRSVEAAAMGGSFPTRTPLGSSSMVFLPDATEEAEFGNFEEAAAYCETRGMRLCEPSELRRSRALFSLPSPAVSSWTRAECAGCLQLDTEVKCETGVLGSTRAGSEGERKRELLVETYLESWNSGYAVEVVVGGQGTTPVPLQSATLCMGAQEVVALAACCADC